MIRHTKYEASIATSLDPKQVVTFEELLMSQVVQQEALTRLLMEKGIHKEADLGGKKWWAL